MKRKKRILREKTKAINRLREVFYKEENEGAREKRQEINFVLRSA